MISCRNCIYIQMDIIAHCVPLSVYYYYFRYFSVMSCPGIFMGRQIDIKQRIQIIRNNNSSQYANLKRANRVESTRFHMQHISDAFIWNEHGLQLFMKGISNIVQGSFKQPLLFARFYDGEKMTRRTYFGLITIMHRNGICHIRDEWLLLL